MARKPRVVERVCPFCGHLMLPPFCRHCGTTIMPNTPEDPPDDGLDRHINGKSFYDTIEEDEDATT